MPRGEQAGAADAAGATREAQRGADRAGSARQAPAAVVHAAAPVVPRPDGARRHHLQHVGGAATDRRPRRAGPRAQPGGGHPAPRRASHDVPRQGRRPAAGHRGRDRLRAGEGRLGRGAVRSGRPRPPPQPPGAALRPREGAADPRDAREAWGERARDHRRGAPHRVRRALHQPVLQRALGHLRGVRQVGAVPAHDAPRPVRRLRGVATAALRERRARPSPRVLEEDARGQPADPRAADRLHATRRPDLQRPRRVGLVRRLVPARDRGALAQGGIDRVPGALLGLPGAALARHRAGGHPRRHRDGQPGEARGAEAARLLREHARAAFGPLGRPDLPGS